eukprot:GILJ01003099.1.p1 GENE.GILJ01003099.1~~GILJ01003099.1.p1  ORF type:complete len:468 (-),score=68.07 GILJ01003099.1:132-1535(-)
MTDLHDVSTADTSPSSSPNKKTDVEVACTKNLIDLKNLDGLSMPPPLRKPPQLGLRPLPSFPAIFDKLHSFTTKLPPTTVLDSLVAIIKTIGAKVEKRDDDKKSLRLSCHLRKSPLSVKIRMYPQEGDVHVVEFQRRDGCPLRFEQLYEKIIRELRNVADMFDEHNFAQERLRPEFERMDDDIIELNDDAVGLLLSLSKDEVLRQQATNGEHVVSVLSKISAGETCLLTRDMIKVIVKALRSIDSDVHKKVAANLIHLCRNNNDVFAIRRTPLLAPRSLSPLMHPSPKMSPLTFASARRNSNPYMSPLVSAFAGFGVEGGRRSAELMTPRTYAAHSLDRQSPQQVNIFPMMSPSTTSTDLADLAPPSLNGKSSTARALSFNFSSPSHPSPKPCGTAMPIRSPLLRPTSNAALPVPRQTPPVFPTNQQAQASPKPEGPAPSSSSQAGNSEPSAAQLKGLRSKLLSMAI